MGISFILLVVVAVVSIITGSFGCFIEKRSTTGDDTTNIDYPDYSPKNENYPVVPKRAALLFDQLMVALQKVVDNQGKGSVGSKTSVGSKDLIGSTGISKPPAHHFNSKIVPMVDDQTMDLQRRALAQSELFWRCYFNALACFKKK
ncbi:PREDICTED: uncharacterized protein LOC108748054 [Trachymyrmex septentrionalis]|uniref:uncharacterized protein LOC108748054 n=1 Tax=Trachymyrmex septentrionalis TaxID=34720 RepID=UPI00084F5C13|nr:PREDICTED: uncharacterized protein LOC108748054 [Trachymyrmex septentrionalis]